MNVRNIIKDSGRQILIGTLSSLLGVIILFMFKSYLDPNKNLTGAWTVYVRTEKTEYTAFKNLTCVFKFQMVQSDDNMLTGTGEKIYDINPDGSKTSYKTVQRDRINFQGKINQSFFGNSSVFLEMIETGSRFTTTTNFKLMVPNNDSVSGVFNTTIANGSGHVKMLRD